MKTHPIFLRILLASLVLFTPGQILVAHAAPGDLKSILYGTQYYNPDACTNDTGDVQTVMLPGSDNIQQAFNFLVGHLGITPAQSAGIVGNFMWESGGGTTLDPTAQENGSKGDTPINSVGFGIAQWTFTSRQKPLVDLANQQGVKPNTLPVQLTYVLNELTGIAPAQNQSAALAAVKTTSTAADAATKFMNIYEAPAAAYAHLADRISAANSVLATYGKDAPVSVTDPDEPSCTPSAPTIGDPGLGSSGSSVITDSIASTAAGLIWPKPNCKNQKIPHVDATGKTTYEVRSSCYDATQAYLDARNKYDNNSDPTDCGVFVANVMRMSKADPNYPKVSTSDQYDYVVAHPTLYKIIHAPSNTSQLAPGDILILQHEHTEMYIGMQKSGFALASASYTQYTPEGRDAGDLVWFGQQKGKGAYVGVHPISNVGH